jgi:hypothetical protein
VFVYETKSVVNFKNSKVKLKSGQNLKMLNKEKCGIWLHIINVSLHKVMGWVQPGLLHKHFSGFLIELLYILK